VFLTREERGQAPWINKALEAAEALASSGIRETATILSAARDILAAHAPLGEVDYLEAVDPDSMRPVARVEGPVVLAAAVRFSKARLIDNRLAAPPEAA
jgi:pantoate--beta-alanine ligase